MSKNSLLNEIKDTLDRVVSNSGIKIDPLSRSTSINIMISIDEPKDTPSEEFSQKILVPILEKFKQDGWNASTTYIDHGCGLYIKLT